MLISYLNSTWVYKIGMTNIYHLYITYQLTSYTCDHTKVNNIFNINTFFYNCDHTNVNNILNINTILITVFFQHILYKIETKLLTKAWAEIP